MAGHDKKKLIRHFVVLILIAAVLFVEMSAPGVVSAVNDDSGIVRYASESYVNPIYSAYSADEEHVESKKFGAPESGTKRLTSYDAIVEYLRSCMQSRIQNVSILYVGSYSGTTAKQFISNAVNEAYNGEYDFTPDDGDYISYSFSGYSFNITYTDDSISADFVLSYHTTKEQEDLVTEKVNELLALWDFTGYTTIDIIKYVHDYIVTHVTYDKTYSKYDAYHALIEGSAVCQGYSLLAYRLLNELGIDCRIISGEGNGGPHAWNIVKVGDKYFNIDFTWDSTRMTGTSPVYDYFLLSEEAFINHKRDDKYLTEEFTGRYPIYELSYYNDKMLNVSAPNYSFKTPGGNTVTGSSSQYSLIIMGDMRSQGVKTMFQSIVDKDIDDVSDIRLIGVDVYTNPAQLVSSSLAGISSKIIACYDSSGRANQTMFSMAEAAGAKNANGDLTIPLTVIIDRSGKIRYAYTGTNIIGERILSCFVKLGVIESPDPGYSSEPMNTQTPDASASPSASPDVTDGPTAAPTGTPVSTSQLEDDPDTTTVPSVPTTEPTVDPSTLETDPTTTPSNGNDVPTASPISGNVVLPTAAAKKSASAPDTVTGSTDSSTGTVADPSGSSQASAVKKASITIYKNNRSVKSVTVKKKKTVVLKVKTVNVTGTVKITGITSGTKKKAKIVFKSNKIKITGKKKGSFTIKLQSSGITQKLKIIVK